MWDGLRSRARAPIHATVYVVAHMGHCAPSSALESLPERFALAQYLRVELIDKLGDAVCPDVNARKAAPLSARMRTQRRYQPFPALYRS